MEPPWQSADPLGEVLHLLRMSSVFYSHAEFTAPWALTLPALPGALMFHIVIAGQCMLMVDGVAPRTLGLGDLALVPHGEGHLLASAAGVPAVELFDLPHDHDGGQYEVIRHGGGGAPATLVCGALRLAHPCAQQLVAQLPRLLVADAPHSPTQEWMSATVRLMAEEARTFRPGGETVLTRLADVLVIHAIRDWLTEDPAARTGWLGAVQDRQIGRAVLLMHRDPAQPWTVGSLAHEAAMSRSAFAERFAALVGEPPLRYLTRRRMILALDRLRDEPLAVAELAAALGYQSEAAFSRAFKRVTGMTPGAARKSREGTA